MRIPRFSRLTALLSSLVALLVLSEAEATAQSGCRPMPPGLVVLWDADDIHYHAWHNSAAYAPDITDRISGPPLKVAEASQSTAEWGEAYSIADVGGPRGMVFRPDWVNNGGRLRMSAADHPKLDFTHAMTVEFWFRSSAPQFGNLYKYVIEKSRDPYSGYPDRPGFDLHMSLATGQIYFHVVYSVGQTLEVGSSASTNLLDGGWHHVAATYDFSGSSGTMNLYIDGALHQSAPVSQPMVPNDQPLNIGTYGNGTFGALVGDFDGIGFYDRALGPAEILSIYAANGAPMCVPMFPNRIFDHQITVPGFPLPWQAQDLDVNSDHLVLTGWDLNAQTAEARVYPRQRGSAGNPVPSLIFSSPYLIASSISGDTMATLSGGYHPILGSSLRVFIHRFDALTSTWVAETCPEANCHRAGETLNAWTGPGKRLIALDGDTLAVYQDDWYQNNQPAVIDLFRRSAGVWSPEQSLPGTADSIALQGDVLVVGERTTAGYPNPEPTFGALRIYRRSGSSWSLFATIRPEDLEPGLPSYTGWRLGSHVALEGSRIVATAPGRPAAYVLQMTSSGVEVEGVLQPSDPVGSFGDVNGGWKTGSRVAIENGLIVVSAPSLGANGLVGSIHDYAGLGAAYVYALRGDEWILVSKLRHGYYAQGGFFDSIALEGGLLYSIDGYDARVIETTALNTAVSSVRFFGAGCGSSVPMLAPAPSSAPAIGTTFRTVASSLPVNVPLYALLAFNKSIVFDLAVIGAPGCIIPHELGIVYSLPSTTTGNADNVVPIPNEPLAVGLHFWQQVVAFTFGNPPIVLTNSLEMIVGGSIR